MYHALIIDTNPSRLAQLHHTLTQPDTPFKFYKSMANENEVMQQLRNKDYALVILNIENKNISGLSLCHTIRQSSTIPIILLGGVLNFQMIKQAMAYKINDILITPYTTSDLLSSINNVYTEIKEQFEEAISDEQLTYKVNSENYNHVIDQVKTYVNKRLHQQITLKQISKQLHFNYAYLGQKFKSHENISFNEYVLQQRMERAKQLLVNTDLKIYEIAQEVGYTEIDWFYKKFKAHTGLSANEYRKKQDYLYAN